MIPKHLDGMSAADILDRMRNNIISNSETPATEFMHTLESLLLLAVQDALLNAEEVKELIQEGEYKAQQRAIVFLNTILPEK